MLKYILNIKHRTNTATPKKKLKDISWIVPRSQFFKHYTDHK